eukprot:TRINITY_DN1623_c0_g1_i1.p1 TRINITY_DN1623_c0_g1~~TRINITY_DN1623_c0_g1_i1.p1  ORF type:complete len:546 (-),score=132.14 TRINITY_DN1623_c0_g1_i1:175-1812(-)
MDRASLLRNRKYGAYSLNALFRKVDPSAIIAEEEIAAANSGLKRVLSVYELIAYGVASTVGAGIFVTIGIVAKNDAGPGVALSFIVAGFASFLSALCYSEFASRVPVSGSAYTFAYVSLGELMGWFVGWNLTLEYAISASAVARGWAGYLVSALQSVGADPPGWLNNYRINSLLSLSPLALAIVVLCTLVLLFGMKESARLNLAVTVINMLIIFFIIIAGSFYVETHNWSPFLPYGFSGIWRGVGTVFFSYIGFDSVSTLAGEVRNPGRDLPIGIVGTLGIATGIYIAVSLVVTGMVSYLEMNVNAPLSQAFFSRGLGWAGTIIAFGSVTTMSATTLVSLIGQPRIFYQMAKDGLIFKIFQRTNVKGVPVWGTIITGVMSGVIAFFLDLDALTNMISIGTLLAFIVVCGGVIVLRYQESDRPARVPLYLLGYFVACIIFAVSFTYLQVLQPWSLFLTGTLLVASFAPFLFMRTTSLPTTFKCPLVPYVPALGILMNVWFIVSLPWDAIVRLLIWTFLGMVLYFVYGIRYSTLRRQEATIEWETTQ